MVMLVMTLRAWRLEASLSRMQEEAWLMSQP